LREDTSFRRALSVRLRDLWKDMSATAVQKISPPNERELGSTSSKMLLELVLEKKEREKLSRLVVRSER